MPCLVAATGPNAGARYEVEDELTLGRSASCGVCLAEDARVSRRHARLLARGGRVLLADLGSRNGTLLNGERLGEEVALQPGDRVQIGETLFLFDPPVKASVAEARDDQVRGAAVEEFLPACGDAAAILRAAMSLLPCPSEAAALRRGAEEALRLLGADAAAALLPGELGLVTAAVIGATEVKVPRPLLQAAERREAARTAGAAVAPLWAGGTAFGLLLVERRDEPLDDRDLGLLGALGRLTGEAVAAARARIPPASEGVLVGTSRVFRRALDQARRVAAMPHPVVLVGEPGTGKALCAHYLHARSARALGPFVRVDGRAPAPVLEEELFGRPAGPGAPPRPGALARADGGTLALLAVEALPQELAARLARELRARRGAAVEAFDVRVVVSAREPVARLAALGRLEPALADLVEGVEVALPPLRERRTDVPQLFEHFAARVGAGKLPQLSPEAKEALLTHAWPGNVRELRLCAERLALAYPGQEIRSSHLPREIAGGPDPAPGAEKLAEAVARLERDVIAKALRSCGGKKIKAAALLGISRPTLDKKIATYKLAVR